jgi:hypothetical protein
MKRMISLMVLALLTVSATAQTTDRLSASSVLNYSSRGSESDKDLIEIFRYEAQLEGKRWNTNFYDDKGYYGAKTAEERDAYMEKAAAMEVKYPVDHRKLVIIQMPAESPFALTYDVKDTSLVVLKSNEEKLVWDKTKIKVAKMKVDVAMYDSIQMLHMLANYTAVPMDQRPFDRLVHFVKPKKDPNALHSGLFPNDLEFTHLHFVWGDYTGDKYAKTHNCESEMAKILKRTFIHICWAVYNNRPDLLDTLEDTIHLLQIQYRRLLLPDVNIDGISLDKFRRDVR